MNSSCLSKFIGIGVFATMLHVAYVNDCNAQPQQDWSKASISFRVGTAVWMSDQRFEALLDLFDHYKGVTDQVTFFSSVTHAPLPLKDFESRMKILKKRLTQTRSRGYQAGINILTTIGHHEEDLDHSLKGNYTPVTDMEGNISKGAYCPNDQNFQQYIRTIYRLAAQANPDYIWIDDDVRLAGHMPVTYTCFCHHCLSIFETETQLKWSREKLAKAFSTGTQQEKLQWRNAWLDHNRGTITRLFRLIETTVHAVDPNLILGFMTGDRFYEGYAFDNWAATLSGKSRANVWWRPGGGYYHDGQTAELAGKSHDIGRQVSMLPKEVVVIQSEIENFPYQRMKKAASITALEAASHIAAGCTGAAFNVLSFYDEPLDEYKPLLEKLQQTREFFNRLVAVFGRQPLLGASMVWDRNSFATTALSNHTWPGGGSPVIRPEQYELGIPASYDYRQAAIAMLTANNIYTLTDSMIRELLSKAVYLDVPALEQLNKLGYGKLTGFTVSDTALKDRIEAFTPHPINQPFANRQRDNRQSFNRDAAYGIRATQKGAEVLSCLVDYAGEKKSGATMGVFENELGGRIAVSGYYPWHSMGSLSKSSQMKNVFRWLSRDKLPGYVASFHKVNCWMRHTRDGKLAMAITNSSFDVAKELTVMLRVQSAAVTVYNMDGSVTTISASGEEGMYKKFTLPNLEAWQMLLVVAD
ncbi:MAG: hypothetical protein ACTHMM_12720 [Agriterribacter sp.]